MSANSRTSHTVSTFNRELIYFSQISFKSAKSYCKLNFKNIRRRGKLETLVKLGSSFQKTFYYSPSEFKILFSSGFLIKLKKPVGITLPPSYLGPFFKNKILLLKILNSSESLFSFSFFSDFADHFFIVACKCDNALQN